MRIIFIVLLLTTCLYADAVFVSQLNRSETPQPEQGAEVEGLSGSVQNATPSWNAQMAEVELQSREHLMRNHDASHQSAVYRRRPPSKRFLAELHQQTSSPSRSSPAVTADQPSFPISSSVSKRDCQSGTVNAFMTSMLLIAAIFSAILLHRAVKRMAKKA